MSHFAASYKGIGDLLKCAEMQAEMVRRAEKVKARAEAIAPYDEKAKDGTHYRDSFTVTSGVSEMLKRAYAKIENSDDAALWIEVGTRDTPKHRTLGKALDAAKD